VNNKVFDGARSIKNVGHRHESWEDAHHGHPPTGSPTTVQAWRTCPLWELSASHPILV